MTREAVTEAAGPERDLPHALAAGLTASGALSSRRWISAFEAVPRHVFVPRIFIDHSGASAYELLDGDAPGRRREWLEQVYADEPLVTRLDGDVRVSSSSQPSLIAMMLVALTVAGSERVLEVSTGTGYNAALLCAGLGSEQAVSIDIDASLVGTARARLHGLGYAPGLAPYDRIIAACSMPRIPAAWIAQTARGGLIMINLYRELGGRRAGAAGRRGRQRQRSLPADLRRVHAGPFRAASNGADLLGRPRSGGTQRETPIDATVLDDDAFGMFAALRLPAVQRIGLLPPASQSKPGSLATTGRGHTRLTIVAPSHRAALCGCGTCRGRPPGLDRTGMPAPRRARPDGER